MKRMSEVFKLPVEKDDAYVLLVSRYGDEEQQASIVNCINHVDALADALQKLLDDACDNGMHNRTSVYAAGKALAAYRGDK